MTDETTQTPTTSTPDPVAPIVAPSPPSAPAFVAPPAVAPPTPTPAATQDPSPIAARLAELETALAASQLAQTKAAEVARRQAIAGQLAGIRSRDYLTLAPAVELDPASGDLTPASVEALGAFRAAHPALFADAATPPAPGSTPVSASPSAGQLPVTAADSAHIQSITGLRLEDLPARMQSSPLHSIRGWRAPVQHQNPVRS